MNTHKLLTSSAAVAALFPVAALAAIDDQGMQYVTAAEGLHGTLRVDILSNSDKDPNDGVAGSATDVTSGGSKERLGLWITGSGDIGNGWATTYFWEVRDGSQQDSGGTLGTEAWTVGFKGPIGTIDFGRTAMVAPRMVPGGSLDTIYGGNAAHFAADVDNNIHRFESNTINGFQVGVSAMTAGSEVGGEDDLFDEYSFAVKYSSPLGFQVGAGYEVDVMHSERYTGAEYADYDDRTGWRFGARYGQDNWLLGYEYRSYEGLEGWDGNLNFTSNTSAWINSASTTAIQGNTAVNATTNLRPAGSRGVAATVVSDMFNSRISYQVHRMGVQVKFDRITASAGYSLETQSLDVSSAADLDQTAIAFDVAYSLGARSLIAVGWKQVESEKWGRYTGTQGTNNTSYADASMVNVVVDGPESTDMKIHYRVDF